MNDRVDIKSFAKELEEYSKQKLNYRTEVGEIMQIAIDAGDVKEFEDMIFHAKFVIRTKEIMKRIGPGADGFEKLSAEFQSGVEKAETALNKILENAHPAVARKIKSLFNTEEIENLDRLMNLFNDMSWIKNWQIDGKPLPFETNSGLKSNNKSGAGKKESEPFIRIQKSAIFIIVLFILFFFFDPPVTIIGWILLLGIAVFLVYIVIQIFILNRIKNSKAELK